MKRTVIIALLLVLIGWSAYTIWTADDVANDPDPDANQMNVTQGGDDNEHDDQAVVAGIQRGNQAPDFTLQTLSGEPRSLSDFRGKPVMLNFWASWCGPCRAEMPDMQAYYEANDVHMVAVNMTLTEESGDDVQSFVDELGLTFPILMDDTGEVGAAYQIRPLPTSFLIDEEGIIHQVVYGPMNEEMMDQQFTQIAAE